MEERHHIALMFRRPRGGSDTVLAALTHAEYMHVDMFFVPPLFTHERGGGGGGGGYKPNRNQQHNQQEQERQRTVQQLFSAYMHEEYSAYEDQDWKLRCNGTHTLLVLHVEKEEYERGRKYACDMCVAKVPYNYFDLVLLGMPNRVAMSLMRDVQPYPIPSRLYCSQACLLLLRHAVSPSRHNAALLQTMAQVRHISQRKCGTRIITH